MKLKFWAVVVVALVMVAACGPVKAQVPTPTPAATPTPCPTAPAGWHGVGTGGAFDCPHYAPPPPTPTSASKTGMADRTASVQQVTCPHYRPYLVPEVD